MKCPVKRGSSAAVLTHGLKGAGRLMRALVMVSEMRLEGAHKAMPSVQYWTVCRIDHSNRRQWDSNGTPGAKYAHPTPDRRGIAGKMMVETRAQYSQTAQPWTSNHRAGSVRAGRLGRPVHPASGAGK